MFLRLCVVGLAFSVQTVLADEVSPFEGQLKQYQDKMPAACQIKSPAMKVAYACSALQSSNSNPRFYSTIDAGQPGSPSKSSNGVNFCYNSLVTVAKLGDTVRVQVIRDSGQSPKRQIFQTSQRNLKDSGGEYNLPLDDQKGICFGYTEAMNSNCGGAFTNSDVQMTVHVAFDATGNPTHSMTAERGVINDARRNASQLNKSAAEVNPEDIGKSVVIYARQQLLARAKQNMQPQAAGAPKDPTRAKLDKEAYQQCDSMLINFESTLKTPVEKDPGQEQVLAEYRNRLKGVTQTPQTGSGNGGGVREGVGGR